MLWNVESPLAVIPVLVGPLQVLLALLPAMLLAFGGALLALFKPSGMRKLIGFLWHQKVFSVCLLLLGLAIWQGYPRKLWSGMRNALGLRAAAVTESARAGEWPTSRGGPHRTGYAGGDEPTAAGSHWSWNDHKTVFSSPTVAGDRVYFTTVTGIGPFTPTGKGAVVCVDAESGREQWRYEGDDGDLRGTFSSPAVGEERIVVGEGLHQTSDARVTCLDLSGRKIWDYRTASHVESTPCIHAGRVYVACAGDGFYCFDLAPDAEGKANVVWHLAGDRYADCESSPVTDGQTVWFGLGEGGNAIVAVNAADGSERWRVTTPYPVFAAPTFVADNEREGHGWVYVGMGNGNFMFSADDLRAARVEAMRDEGKSADQIAAAEKALATAGAVWCLNAATGHVEWQHDLPDTVLDSIAYQPPTGSGPDRLFFGSRDGFAYALSADGTLLGKWNAGSPILASPALGRNHVYFATKSGRLFALKSDTLQPVWDMTVQQTGTLTSSPALADGRVFIGTEDQGLRCVGTNEPSLPPLWDRESLGGMADDTPLPSNAEVAWTLKPPLHDDKGRSHEGDQFQFLIPLDQSLYAIAGAQELTSYVRLIRIQCPASTRADADGQPASRPSIAWQEHLHLGYPLALSGCGDRVFAVFHQDHPSRRIAAAFDAKSARLLWKNEWVRKETSPRGAAMIIGGPTYVVNCQALDTERLYLWTGSGAVACVSQRSGENLWMNEKVCSEGRSGRLLRHGDYLICSTTDAIVVLDSSSGRLLWRQPLESPLIYGPILCGGHIAVLTRDDLRVLEFQDGALRRQTKTGSLVSVERLISWESRPDRLLIQGRDATFVNLAEDLPTDRFFPEGHDSPGHRIELTAIQRGDEFLIQKNNALAWWRPEDDNLTPFFDLGGMSRSRGTTFSHRGHVYFADPKYGIVCLRGVTP